MNFVCFLAGKGDSIYRNGLWILDSNGSRRYEASDRVFAYGQAANIPVVGAWNGSKPGKVGVFRNGLWILDSNGNGWFDALDWVFAYG